MSRSKKIVELIICFNCGRELSRVAKVYEEAGHNVCYRCFLSYRQAERIEAERKEKNKVRDRMYIKKFYCPACKALKNDLEVTFCVGGVSCMCGRYLSFKGQQLFKKRIPPIDKDIQV